MLAQFQISRRTFLASAPMVAFLSACGMGSKSPSADQLMVDSILDTKHQLLPTLATFPIVASQQQEHINALLPFSSNQPTSTPSAVPSGTPSTGLAELSARVSVGALSATNVELRRLLLLIAASDAVHSQVST